MEIRIAILISAIAVLIFMPIKVKITAYASFREKKIFYSFFVFGIIRVNSGFITFTKNRFILHFSDKKAVAVEYAKLLPKDDSPNPINFVSVNKVVTSLVIDPSDSAEKFMFAAAVNALNSLTFVFLKRCRPTLSFRGNEILVASEEAEGYAFETSFKFGVYSIIGYYISKLFSGVKNVKKQFGK